MAQYDVDIQLAIRNKNALQGLQRELNAINDAVDAINDKSIDVTGKRRENAIKDLYKNVEDASLKVLEKLDKATTTAHKNQQKVQLKLEDDLFQDKLDKINKLADAEIAASKEANEAALKDFDQRLENRVARRKGSLFGTATARERAGAAVSAGAFPLLFGGGPGMALGGAVGGAVSGSTFGAPAIALQVLGGAVDTYVAQLTELADSLSSTQDILSGLENAGYRVSDATKSVIASYEEAGLFADAYAIALEEINRVLGPDGAAKLSAYNDETKKLQSEIEKITASLQSELLPVFTGLIRVILGAKAAFDQFADSPLGKLFLQGGKQIAINLLPGLGGAERVLGVLQNLGAPTGEPGIPDSVRLAQENAGIASRTAQLNASQAAQERIYLIDAQNKAIQAGNNLLDERVVAARKNVIQEEYLAKMRKEGLTDAEKTLIEREKTQALLRLNSQITAAELADQEKKTRELERQNAAADRLAKKQQAAADRLAKKQQRAIERQIKAADRELERATAAFDKVDSQLDAIITKNKDKVAFEREYAELIRNGSTPAAARQAIELKKQQLELDRNFEKLKEQLDLQVKVAEAAILEAKARGASGAELDALNQALADLLEKIGKLPGKKENAEGAILEALAPKSDRERLQEYLDKVQGQINDLMDPVKQITSLADTLGGAFSESFKGIVSGSMTAREALANLFQRTADHFLDMAAQMIAAQIKMQAVKLFMSFFPSSGGGGGGGNDGSGFVIPSDNLTPTANGNAFGRNGLIPFAKGGVVNKPTLFPFANGTGLMGEAGPEAIMPLSRGPGGRLGVEAVGGGAGATNIVVNVDASGSSVEGDSDQAAQLGKMLGAAVQAELVKQKRPGGLLAS